jgi:hypothetical protein
MLLAPWKKGESLKKTSCGPSNFDGDGLHLILLKQIQTFGSSSFVIHIAYCDKVANTLNLRRTEMVMKHKRNK